MTTYTRTLVSIDDFGPFPALVEDGDRWNGFAIAWFTWEAMNDIAQQIAGEVRDPNVDSWIEIDPVHKFVEHSDGLPTPCEMREIRGTRYWTLSGWCWMEANPCGVCGDERCDCGRVPTWAYDGTGE
jgi:hypothetical protein